MWAFCIVIAFVHYRHSKVIRDGTERRVAAPVSLSNTHATVGDARAFKRSGALHSVPVHVNRIERFTTSTAFNTDSGVIGLVNLNDSVNVLEVGGVTIHHGDTATTVTVGNITAVASQSITLGIIRFDIHSSALFGAAPFEVYLNEHNGWTSLG